MLRGIAVVVLHSGSGIDLAVARDRASGQVIVIANLSAGRRRLLAQAETLLEPAERAELAAILPDAPPAPAPLTLVDGDGDRRRRRELGPRHSAWLAVAATLSGCIWHVACNFCHAQAVVQLAG